MHSGSQIQPPPACSQSAGPKHGEQSPRHEPHGPRGMLAEADETSVAEDWRAVPQAVMSRGETASSWAGA
ncbi:uncharacterized protein STAUR_6296 [Stigmatella aurantiaca DW4/3-1]|uniref:Uncharacterized protein n=1 Tax=Stigmatella aurantiaca (strain DW4/3-1) TaxID=378806 RepID=E3FH23_STIAD|nr:uncharacterized protein STAUR_6296 [Stigmatella aurantiaca DW4/3-1]